MACWRSCVDKYIIPKNNNRPQAAGERLAHYFPRKIRRFLLISLRHGEINQNPILNSPYRELEYHWELGENGNMLNKRLQGRRESSQLATDLRCIDTGGILMPKNKINEKIKGKRLNSSFDDIMREMRADSTSSADKGKKFEELMCKALPYISPCSEWVKKVYMWRNWPYNEGKPDTGIDLVVEMEDGEWCAVQCKFYDEKTYLEDIATFLATSGQSFYVNGKKKSFNERLLITTTYNLTSNAESTLQKQTTKVMRLGLDELRAAAVDWGELHKPAPKPIPQEKTLHEYQEKAVEAVTTALQGVETRGKMIMACGTGKTLTSMRIVEKIAAKGGNVLFCVPSIQLLSQSLNDYSNDLTIPREERKFLAVCSDGDAGNTEDSDALVAELAFPPTTDALSLAHELRSAKDKMTVVFTTYHSLKVISEAQKEHGAPDFDLVVCDEAHRTVGYEDKNKEEQDKQGFYQIHKDKNIRARRRLYMTATPKVYGTAMSQKMEKEGVLLYGMDVEKIYGKELFHYSFGEGIRDGFLADYCVHILMAKTSDVALLHREVIDEVGAGKVIFEVSDAVKMAGIYKAICGTKAFGKQQPSLKKVLVFANRIKRSEELIEAHFTKCAESVDKLTNGKEVISVKTEVRHVDGKMGAAARNKSLSWLREESEEKECKILSNVRCLSEGVDVPALDGIVFYDARQSQVEIVQALGRVMRKPKGSDKEYGHIIIPICMPDEAEPDQFMDSNDQFKDAWKVLQALRSHDNRFEAEVNQVELTGKLPKRVTVEVFSPDPRTDEKPENQQLPIWGESEAWMKAIVPRWVDKCGNRGFWPAWGEDVGEVAKALVEQIEILLKNRGKHAAFAKVFGEYHKGLQRIVNKDVSETQAVEMLAQHIITKPIFRALFDGYEFGDQNRISKAINKVEKALRNIGVAAGEEILARFYKDVKMHVSGIESIRGRRKMLEKIYGNFFQGAFKKEAKQQGIVYTPPEAVDFINHSVDALLRKHFQLGITDKDVHVLDPFTGCGQFVVRLMESKIIKDKDLPRKYREEIHANEKMLLPFYVATVNIEHAYQDRMKAKEYVPFASGLLADTFNLGEKKGDYVSKMFEASDKHSDKQRDQPIHVIIANPPYSGRQKKESDQVPNPPPGFYPKLDKELEDTFIKPSAVQNTINHDSAYRALRWSMSRIANDSRGVIGFVTTAAFLRGPQTDAIRKTLEEEMSEVYVLDLRGDANTKGEQRKKEKGNIFGGGTKVPVCVILMVKKPKNKGVNDFILRYHDIGDYQSREQKLKFLKDNKQNLSRINWQIITPSPDGDWLSQRHPDFQKFCPIASKEKQKPLMDQNRKAKNGKLPIGDTTTNSDLTLFDFYSLGVITGRDDWAIGFSQERVSANMKTFIGEYNKQVQKHKRLGKTAEVDRGSNIKWSGVLLDHAKACRTAVWSEDNIRTHYFRPFVKKHIYYGKMMTDSMRQITALYIKGEQNPTICVPGRGAQDWGAIAMNTFPGSFGMPGSLYVYPFYNYLGGKKRENISDATLDVFCEFYKNQKISKWDIFHYVYGVLNHPSYRQVFEGNLDSEKLPRIPFVHAVDFMDFVKAGKRLMNLHLNYEDAAEYDIQQCDGQGKLLLNINRESVGDSLKKMSFLQNTGKGILKYNDLFFRIPKEALAYKTRGYSPLEWVEQQYKHSTSDIGEQQDPNDWGKEHGKPGYIWSLVRKSITIGIESADIIASMPELKYTTPDYKKLGKG